MNFKTISALLILTPVIWVVVAQDNDADADAYLSPELRSRVEKLKVDAPRNSTDVDVLSARLATLWDWANAYSLTGGTIPGSFPQTTANANRGLRRLPNGGAQLRIAQVSDEPLQRKKKPAEAGC